MADLESQITTEEALRELQSRYERLQLLYQVQSQLHSTLEPERALQLLVTEIVRAMRASSGSVIVLNPTTGFLEIEAAHGLPQVSRSLKLRVGEGITGWVARTGKPARVGDVSKDPRYIMVRKNVRSELAVPLEVGGELRGVINVDSDRLEAFSQDDEELLQALARQAAQVIHNTWHYEQSRQRARLFEALISVSQSINTSLNLDDVLEVVTREACQLMNGKLCSILMLDPAREWLDLRASYGAGEAYMNKPRLSLSDSLLGSVVRRKKALQVENVQLSNRYQHVEVAREEGLVSLLSVPLTFLGNCIGTLNIYTAVRHSFSNEEIRIISALAELSALAIEKARLYERIVDMEEQLRRNEKLSAIGLLAAEVAHEIRNPLTVIKMLHHSLDLNFAPNDPRARDVEVMRERIEHLNKIVEQVLQFARNADPILQPVDVNGIIEELALLLRHKFQNQKIKFTKQLQPDLPLAQADAAQLSQVLLNLMLNAVEAMPGGGRLTIKSYSVLPKQGGVAQIGIEIKDTGNGFTDLQRKHLFRGILQTTKEGGTGLGLAIVSKIIEAHQGEIKLTSRAGSGSTFKVLLPAATR